MRNRFSDLSEEDETKIDITPMLDVVFIMLIFFIVTATFVNESGIDLLKPEVPIKDNPEQNKKSILITINADDSIEVSGQKTDFRTVTARVTRLRSEKSDAPVVVQVSKRSRNKTLVRVLDSIREAGVYDSIIAPSTE